MTAQSVPWAGSSPGFGTHMEIVHVAELGGGRSQSKDVQAVGARAGEGGEPCAGYCLSSQTGSSSDAGILYPVPCGTSGEFFFKKNESGAGHIICHCSQTGLAVNSKQSISKDSDSQRRVNSSEVLIQAFSPCEEQKVDGKPAG